ncbi:MAG: hypothetical protein GY953_15010 [bacterium]|nr:hypothetical protein [bacterium]
MTPTAAFERLLEVLDRLEIHYMVAGSGASSTHGIWRATGDIDIVVRMDREDIPLLVEELERDFYIDAGQIRSALDLGRSFNVIHFKSAYKFDIFPLGTDRYAQAQFGRRRFETTTLFGPTPIEFCVATAEDVILSKLRWYKLGGGISEQQWNDVLGVIAVQGERLDLDYMREWAAYLEVADLLEEALVERHGDS